MGKVIDFETERLARLPMLDTNLKDTQELVQRFVNQLAYLGNGGELRACCPVDKYVATVSVTFEAKDE